MINDIPVLKLDIVDQEILRRHQTKIKNNQILVKVVKLSEEIKIMKPLTSKKLNDEVYEEENV